MDIKLSDLNINSSISLDELKMGVRTISSDGGTSDYKQLTNLPRINNVTLIDNVTTEELGVIEDVETYIEEHKEELKGENGKDGVNGVDGKDGYTPVKGVDYFTEEDKQEFLNEVESKIEIPTKVSELENDKNYATTQEVAEAISKIDLTDYMKNKGTEERPLYNNQELALVNDIPTKTSQLTNDSNFITSDSLPTKTSQLINDSDFITSSALPKNLSDLTNDKEYQTKTDVEALIETAVGVALGGSY